MDLQALRCKNCGAELDVRNAVEGVIECEYCFSKFTVSKDETPAAAKQYLHDGESSLDVGEFDKAYTYYQKAAELAPTEPEAYFGMALAEFGIQYLNYKDDNGNPQMQPICHIIDDKVFSDSTNYFIAFKYATPKQREEYERKAADIDYIRKEFFKLQQSGLDYDCFICVKVTDDATGGRTADYKTADDLYYELRKKGFKPFFSEIELTGMTGADYEAGILYALVMSECMLLVCSKEEYLKTKWVKNEYTRFLRLVNDQEKESDSIAIVYNGKPIERLEGKNGRIQGIDNAKMGSLEKIVSFVDSHTLEAKKRREDAARRQEEQAKHKEKESADRKAKEEAERRAREAAVAREFEIENGVLKKYKGGASEVVIPAGGLVTSIGDAVFAGCSSLRSIEIPQGVTSIGRAAFSGCSSLRSIEIPQGVTSIGRATFSGCFNLTSIGIPQSVTSIGGSAFSGCTKLMSIEIPQGVTSIGYATFERTGLKCIEIPQGVTSIGGSAFSGCDNLTDVTISSSVTSIGDSAFWDTGLKKILTIKFLGTRKEWNAIKKVKGWNGSSKVHVRCKIFSSRGKK